MPVVPAVPVVRRFRRYDAVFSRIIVSINQCINRSHYTYKERTQTSLSTYRGIINLLQVMSSNK